MDYEQFLRSLDEPNPPPGLELALKALWFDANDRADSAIRTAEFDTSHFCKRVRAYLYRKSGDAGNAELWYWRAGTPPWSASTQSEWEDIVKSILVEQVVNNAYS